MNDNIDVVIPLGTGSTWDNNELRYCLRSIEKYLKNYNNIYIVGEKPDFINWNNGIFHIPFIEGYHASKNIIDKLIVACSEDKISNDFIMFNDDHFLLQDTTATNYLEYYDGKLIDRIYSEDSDNWYHSYLDTTLNTLLEKGSYKLKYYDIHRPIIFNKDKLIEIHNNFDWNKKLLIKTIYCNYHNIKTDYPAQDFKIKEQLSYEEVKRAIWNRSIFSIGDRCLKKGFLFKPSGVKLLLEQLYSKPSKYEK